MTRGKQTKWSEAEHQLLLASSKGRSMTDCAIEYHARSQNLNYPDRSLSAIQHKIVKINGGKQQTRPRWTAEEKERVSELFEDYPAPLACRKYLDWARANNYPDRSEHMITAQSRRVGCNTLDHAKVAGISSIGRTLNLHSSTIRKYLDRSPLRVRRVGDRVTCNVPQFYKWFVESGAWIDCLRGFAVNRKQPDLDTWSLVLEIDRKQIESTWHEQRLTLTRVKAPMGAPMLVGEFAAAHGTTANSIRSAINQGRSNVGQVRFEVC